MKIAYNWLKQHLTFTPEVNALDSMLTQLGLEVEDICSVGITPDQLKGLVVGEVMSCETHPNADKLKLTQVDIGTGELLKIVCGAPNVTKGMKVVVATIGTTLYPKGGESFKIKKSKIRGEESNGMLCAEDEIGLGTSHAGLLVLPSQSIVGADIASVLTFDTDAVIEIGITPNHADACSHLGVARELRAAMLNQGLETNLIFDFKNLPTLALASIPNPIKVTVADASHCPRYAGLYIEGITVQESPEWLQAKLKSIGLKPINTIVDITNYVLHDIGQPIHAFDAAKIQGHQINVRLSNSSEKFVTLDGVNRTLEATELMICDEKNPIAIAGVFGGLQSGVSATTTAVFLESAYFNPGTVRKSAKTHALNTDASFRFERGTDPEIVRWALYYTAKLILETAGGNASQEIVDIYPMPIPPFEIKLRYSFLKQIIGKVISAHSVKQILIGLNCTIKAEDEEGLIVVVPSYKNDVTTETDLCEEILRVHGLNNIELPGKITTAIVLESKNQLPTFREKLSQNLCNKGFNEIMTNSLTKVTYNTAQATQRVAVLNPLSSDLGVLRGTMIFSGLEAVAYNLNRNQFHLQLFEIGKTYSVELKGDPSLEKNQKKYKEEEHCAIFLTGKEEKLSAIKPVTAPNFYTLKTIVEQLLNESGLFQFTTQPSANEYFKYGIAYYYNNKMIAEIGAIENACLKQLDIQQEVFYADLLMKNIYKYSAKGFTQIKAVSKFPSVRRDLSLLIDDNIQFQQLELVAKKAENNLLKEVGVFDIYKGENLGAGKKSYALYFILQDEEKTLDDKSINHAMQRIQVALEKELGALIR